MQSPEFVLHLPDWVQHFLPEPNHHIPEVAQRMRLVIELARQNIEHGTGGPFAAGVFEQEKGTLLSVGINLVEQLHCSVAHAEIVAIMLAQQQVKNFDLGCSYLPAYELVSSTEPCAMCLGAIPWSGVSSVVCGARDEDARQIGFDEGTKPEDWQVSLESRGISVLRDILRDEACTVLRQYVKSGGLIYNPQRRK